ncbi:porphobilinogen deaminase [bacterium BMS3Abin07]|nr:porphobilinogen deaminase [bacterium BMS3Abin07]GBE32416.1 porphobilinogen deaminase [bacterium BMS3Bbin05]HDL20831.1 hydroxymethylbilane synthase [Nitrospirota bacterium]HDO23355.1 hydroxymethylbilane synthase [Nitrospirota bacterium]HDZ89000.1 hydroxymethylbilane synthase [Nitrospirota bacterium]
MGKRKIVIGTRGSKLALWQAEWVKSELESIHSGLEIELKKIKTTGDRILDVPLAKVGGKGLFVKEIEEAMLLRDIDIAVHSMKDVPTEFPEGLHLAVICRREDPRDAFLSRKSEVESRGLEGKGAFKIRNFNDLPNGAAVGTSSLRRSCQILNIRPDLEIKQLRGNVGTRIRKLDEGQFDAVILAAAGVKRLGMADRITEIIAPEVSLPAIGQGAIGIECRIGDRFVHEMICSLNHPDTEICVRTERAFLRRLEGGCQVPIAAHARLVNGSIVMDGLVGDVEGSRIIRGHIDGPKQDCGQLGISLAEDLLSRGAKEILDEVYNQG